jgi:hypothetical protein
VAGISEKFNADQRETIADCWAIGRQARSNPKRKLSAATISRLASAGELPIGDLEPFQISPSYVRDIGRKRLAERGELYAAGIDTSDPSKANRANLDRLTHLAARETSRLENLQGKGRLDARDVEKLASAIGRIEKVRQDIGGENPPPNNGAKPHAPAPTGEAEPDPFLAGLSQDSAPASDPT